MIGAYLAKGQFVYIPLVTKVDAQTKYLVQLEYMSCKNHSFTNYLYIFVMASKLCLINLYLSMNQRETLFELFYANTEGSALEKIILQLFNITQQDSNRYNSCCIPAGVQGSTLTNIFLITEMHTFVMLLTLT